jgi:hypothetical protein
MAGQTDGRVAADAAAGKPMGVGCSVMFRPNFPRPCFSSRSAVESTARLARSSSTPSVPSVLTSWCRRRNGRRGGGKYLVGLMSYAARQWMTLRPRRSVVRVVGERCQSASLRCKHLDRSVRGGRGAARRRRPTGSVETGERGRRLHVAVQLSFDGGRIFFTVCGHCMKTPCGHQYCR